MSKFKTAKGIASYPSLNKTEMYQGQDTGYYKTKLILSKADAKPLADMAREVAADEYGPKKVPKVAMPFKVTEDGNVIFTFKSKHKPVVYDAKGQIIEEELKIGSGSILKIAGNFKPQKGREGINAYFSAVMVVELKTYGGGGGFDADDAEEGFSHTPGAKGAFDEDEVTAATDGSEDF